jgi:hypothetical protein
LLFFDRFHISPRGLAAAAAALTREGVIAKAAERGAPALGGRQWIVAN